MQVDRSSAASAHSVPATATSSLWMMVLNREPMELPQARNDVPAVSKLPLRSFAIPTAAWTKPWCLRKQANAQNSASNRGSVNEKPRQKAKQTKTTASKRRQRLSSRRRKRKGTA
jgi:hypothetical protein